MNKQVPSIAADEIARAAELTLTIIIPVRITDARKDLFARLKNYSIDTELPTGIDVIVVDDGSSDDDFLRLTTLQDDRVAVMRTGAKYYQDFSLARARNHAAQRAKGDLLMFLDADLLPYPGFFRDVMLEAKLANIKENVNRFLMLPVIYLTESGYKSMQEMPPHHWRHYFINAMLRHDRTEIEKCSSGTSVIVVDRFYYLARGGQDTGFMGWGYEDYEFSTRLIRRDRKYPMPAQWLSMAGNLFTIRKFEGWKSVYRLYGDWMAAKGIYLFHAPHPIENAYHARKEQNMRYLIERMKIDSSPEPDEPEPLAAFDRGSTLLLRSNPFCYSREFAPLLGHITKAHEDDFADEGAFTDFLREHQFTRVVFGNPYANGKLKGFYNWCRRNGQQYVVSERGALPGSVYHDPNGFLNDSSSYDSVHWDQPLTSDERERTLAYISEIRYGSAALEAQADREDGAALRKRLGIKRNQKVLFVPFQQPNDSVIREFAEPIGSFEAFRSEIARLAAELDGDWVVICKKHPAEDDLLPISNAVSADDAHVYDLLEICDAVALINSGVGIYGMMFGKPVYVFGSSWYAHSGLCRPVGSGEDALGLVREGFDLNYERMLRFIHFLRFRFYSFGVMETKKVRYKDGSPITATTAIKYFEMRWGGRLRRIPQKTTSVSTDSPLFDRYKAALPTQQLVVKNDVTETARSAQQALERGDYLRAAELFKEAAGLSRRPASHYRSAAEALDRAGKTSDAIELLDKAVALAKNNGAIKRRKREMQRHKWMRRIRPEKPYLPPGEQT